MTRTKTALGLAAAFLLVGLFATAAPAPASKPNVDRWEYCEIQTTYTVTAAAAPGAAAGGALPARAALVRVRKIAIRLVVDGEEIETTSWEDLAAKLKAPAAKANATAAGQKLRVLNHLGKEGWELVGHNRDTFSAADVWTFKRKAVK
jgi:hypothetical protein